MNVWAVLIVVGIECCNYKHYILLVSSNINAVYIEWTRYTRILVSWSDIDSNVIAFCIILSQCVKLWDFSYSIRFQLQLWLNSVEISLDTLYITIAKHTF